MTAPFAGSRRNVGLGRSAYKRAWRSPPPRAGAPATRGVLRAPRRGTPSACENKHTHSTRGPTRHSRQRTTSFTRSEDPCTSIATELRRRKPSGVARPDTYRGRANPCKREEPAPGQVWTGACAARRASPLPQGRQRDASEKEAGFRLRPCEESRALVRVPVRRTQLQKSSGGAWSQIRSCAALQKGWRRE